MKNYVGADLLFAQIDEIKALREENTRLTAALESLESYIRAAADDHDCINWYAVNRDEGEAARALLAEIRGNHA